jgi:hypothetical protein
MAAGSWAIWAALSAVLAAASIWHYLRREPPGRGRLLLAGLRALSLSLLLLLLFDPELPAPGSGGGVRGTQVLLDGSLSMDVPTAAGPTRWAHGAAVARERAGGREILLFGERPRPIRPEALPVSAPGDARTRLLPALQAAAEAGVVRVLVVTDGAIEDAEAVARWLPGLGLEVAFHLVGDTVANRSLVEVDVPRRVAAGEPVRVGLGVAASGPVTDSIPVVARVGERVVGRTVLPVPVPGRLATGTLELRLDAAPGGGPVPLTISLEGSDAVPDDDIRTAYVEVAVELPGIALVSFRPDWEPRFLAPVLEQAVGLPVRGFIRGAAGRYVRLGRGLEAGVQVGEADVERAVTRTVREGGLVVFHGIDAGAPAWAVAALRAAPRLLVLPGEDVSGLPLPVQPGPLVAGEFFPARDLPPSPIAPLLADARPVADAAPLAALRTAVLPAGAWAPFLVTRDRQGPPQPAILAGQAGSRRWALVLGTGWWQWAMRGNGERVLYNRLWGALGGWLVDDRASGGPAPVRPAERIVPRGQSIPWVAPGVAADSIALTLTAADGTVALDTVIVASDTTFSRAPAPGSYGYRARAFTGDTVTSAEGVLTVERYSPEFMHQPAGLAALRSAAAPARGGAARRTGTPLHAAAWPYVLLVLLLSSEWLLRRRWGLR